MENSFAALLLNNNGMQMENTLYEITNILHSIVWGEVNTIFSKDNA
jgi:hypothetical protein